MMTAARRRVLTLALPALVLAVATWVVPLWVMRPFRAQGAVELAVALAALRWSPILLGAALALAVWALARAWPQGWGRRLGAASALVAVVGVSAAAQVNVFERLFAPIDAPRFASIAEAGLPDDAVIMAARVGAERRGYPVEVMAYHHVFNDEVGGRPIVVTY